MNIAINHKLSLVEREIKYRKENETLNIIKLMKDEELEEYREELLKRINQTTVNFLMNDRNEENGKL